MSERVYFRKALPVWEKGMENEINYSLVFSGKLKKTDSAVLRITGHGNYNIYVNGCHTAMGPARTAHGFFRVDETDIGSRLTEDVNELKIIVAGYNCGGFYITRQPSFLCAEVEDGTGSILLYTSDDRSPYSFDCRTDTERHRKCQRYGSARTFCEVYTLGGSEETSGVRLSVSDIPRTFIRRHAPYPDYAEVFPSGASVCGRFMRDTSKNIPYDAYDWGIKEGGMAGYIPEDIPRSAFKEAQQFVILEARRPEDPDLSAVTLPSGSYISMFLPFNATGFVSFKVRAAAGADLYITYDELCSDDGFPRYTRLPILNTLLWHFDRDGEYTVETREMYTFKHFCLWALGGDVTVTGIRTREYAYPAGMIRTEIPASLADDPELLSIYESAVRAFRENAPDLYTDCPSRERAGWLCDSFFTGKSEKILTGMSLVERDFLENFMLPSSFERLPDGMLAMCYPAEPDGKYIINWAMWFVIELGEYLKRSGDRDFIDFSKEKVYKLMDFIGKYENSDGLIEKLDSWVFIEWSRSNDLVQDISYPSNMVYSMALDAVGRMYSDSTMTAKAAALRKTVRERSLMPSGFFCDNAVYDGNGKAVLSGECTETCQYYAFVSGVADLERDRDLWNRLRDLFGPRRVDEHNNIRPGEAYPDIAPSNTFIGIMLRLLAMDEFKDSEKLLEDIRGYFGFMAKKTGTIWEAQTDDCSCCHGFGSFVAYLLLRNT